VISRRADPPRIDPFSLQKAPGSCFTFLYRSSVAQYLAFPISSSRVLSHIYERMFIRRCPSPFSSPSFFCWPLHNRSWLFIPAIFGLGSLSEFLCLRLFLRLCLGVVLMVLYFVPLLFLRPEQVMIPPARSFPHMEPLQSPSVLCLGGDYFPPVHLASDADLRRSLCCPVSEEVLFMR